MGNRQPWNERSRRTPRRMGREVSSFSIFTCASLRTHGRWLARETKYPLLWHNITMPVDCSSGVTFLNGLGMKFERDGLEPPASSTRADNSREISWIPAYRRFIARVTLLRINLADKHRLPRTSPARLTFRYAARWINVPHFILLFSSRCAMKPGYNPADMLFMFLI